MATTITTTEPADNPYAEYLEDETPKEQPKKKKLTKAEQMELKQKEEIEFKKLELRDLMSREFEMSKKTAKKYHKHWENMCREVKLKEMKQELEDWEKKVNRVMQQKDEKIQLILDEISVTEEMHKNNFSCQLEVMNYLKDTLKTFQETSRLLYEQQASEILHDFYDEVAATNEIENFVKLNCESVVHATDLLAEQELLSDYNIFLDKRDDRVNTEIEKRYRLRDAVTKRMKDLRKQLIEFLDSLRNVSLDVHKYERINTLMERQRNFVTEAKKLNEIEQHDARVYADLQHHLLKVEADAKRKIHDLKLEHAYFMQIRKNIENEIKLDREQTHEKLKIISSESFKVLKKFQKLHKHGELLLSLATNCRKFQTESEKVVAWGDFQEPLNDNEHDKEPFELEILNLKDHVDMTEAELENNIELMKNFWRRQALAEAQIVLLEEHKQQLLKENQSYIETIKRLSKADNVEDLKETLKVQSVLNNESFL
ncbi:dynein regulatory complex subunit 2 [Lucilia cuprina]|uniref:dynein regulatory complex subunit 2 n=1 Tax=Lucilia cuprina TaxID=7375 RepID=UPI001F06AB90|nr:dynein regulatory complex subunit 2 [Lucilia cuprina]